MSLSGRLFVFPSSSCRPERRTSATSSGVTRTVVTRPRSGLRASGDAARTALAGSPLSIPPGRDRNRALDPDPGEVALVSLPETGDHAAARRDEPRIGAATDDRNWPLRLDEDAQRMREVTVVARRGDDRKPIQTPDDGRTIQRDQAASLEVGECRAYLSRNRRRRATHVDRVHGEHGGLARDEVDACSERDDRERDRGGATARQRAASARSCAWAPEGPPRRRPSARVSEPPRARSSLRRRRRGSYSGRATPSSWTSCSSSTPNCSRARRRASAISASASAVRAESAFSMKFA